MMPTTYTEASEQGGKRQKSSGKKAKAFIVVKDTNYASNQGKFAV